MNGKRIVVFLMLAVTVFLVGCKANLDLEIDDDYTYVTINMTEANAATAIEKILEEHIADPQADLREGEIAVKGLVKDDKTGELLPGQLTFKMWAEDGKLKVEVTSFDFAGWDASPEALDKINRDLAKGMEKDAKKDDTELTDVTIRDGEMSLSFKAPREW